MEEELEEIFGPNGMAGLNIEQGLEVFDDEVDDYITALSSFVKNVPDIIGKLRGVTAENLQDYAINIHGLKSISGWICAENIRASSADLEALAKAGDISAVTARNDQFLNETEAFAKELEGKLEKIK
jgi:HPt (histidine-containing phosphotransfer) domain-containing protein